MSKEWRLIAICGALGLLVTAAIVSYLRLFGMNDDLLTAFVVLCLPSLLCIPFNEAMKKYRSILGHLVVDWTVKLRDLRSHWLGDCWAIAETEGLECGGRESERHRAIMQNYAVGISISVTN